MHCSVKKTGAISFSCPLGSPLLSPSWFCDYQLPLATWLVWTCASAHVLFSFPISLQCALEQGMYLGSSSSRSSGVPMLAAVTRVSTLRCCRRAGTCESATDTGQCATFLSALSQGRNSSASHAGTAAHLKGN